MAQRPPNIPGDAITRGARLTDYASLDLMVEGSASGGMGLVVWGPNALRGNQMTALKLLRPDRVAAATSPEARKTIERQFEAEALTWCHLWPHQSVITAIALARLPGLDDLPILVLGFAPNGSLRERLQRARISREPLPIRGSLAWALHIASALAHIHQRDPNHDRPAPLVHCDLKPENVLLDEDYWALLTDLGLTRAYATLAAETIPTMAPGATMPALETPDRRALVAQLRAELQGQGLLPGMAGPPPLPDATTLFATRTLAIPPTAALAVTPAAADDQIGAGVAGSPPYMAPEQWRGLEQTVPATDMYALGVLLYELFAGFDAPAPFPRDPSPYLTPELYAQALLMGAEPVTLAWHAAHTDPAYRSGGRGQGQRRLSDPAAWEAALRSGPFSELLTDGGAGEGRQRAEACLAGVDALVERCLAYTPAARPAAAEVVETLQALIVETCRLEPIQIPQPLPASTSNEGGFWSNLGTTYGNLREFEKRVTVQRRALEHEPDDSSNLLNLGNALAAMGERSQDAENRALRAGQAAIAEQRRAQARAYREEALEVYRKGQTHLTPEAMARYPLLSTSLAVMEASVLGDLQRYSEAVDAYRRALAHTPGKYDTRFNLALDLARWSQAPGSTEAEQVERLETARAELAMVLAVAPQMRGARNLAERVAQALADPAHRFQG